MKNMGFLVPAVLCLLGVVSGYEDKTIVQYLRDNPREYSNLSSFIDDAGLTLTLESSGPYTIFAPTNDAFAKLDDDTLNNLLTNRAQLTNIMSYHVVHQFVLVPMIGQFEERDTMEGQKLNISSEQGTLVLNGYARVDAGNHDIILRNGVVQPVDTLLMPPVLATLNIAQILLKDDARFKDFFLALLLGGLNHQLEQGNFTVFAPVDSAFGALGDNLLSPDAPNAEAVYRAVLGNHIVTGSRRANQLSDGEALFTLHGTSININLATDSSMTVSGANVIDADIIATNGMIHAIDKLLIPSNINEIIQG